ncbi:MAG: AMP-binding protein [Spirochaetia bacterium]|nr:AMP-binding protein [Spirochaetia bacterium]
MAQTLAQMFLEMTARQPKAVAQLSKDSGGVFRPTSYTELKDAAASFAAGLKILGISRGDKVGLIADNRKEWLSTDLALLGLGAADVPRGCDATVQEIAYILSWSECRLAILENEKQLKKILEARSSMPQLDSIILFDPAEEATLQEAKDQGLSVHPYETVLENGKKYLAEDPGFYEEEAAKGARGDLATLIYTSGTTGDPKGVMLSHGNFMHQTDYLPGLIGVNPGEIFLSVLPVWHSFERILQYLILQSGATIAYSKPIGSILLADMQAVQPHWFPSVPRIWESVKDGIYKSIRQSSKVKRALFGFFVGVGESFAFFRNHLLGRYPRFNQRSRILEIAAALVPFILLAPLWALGNVLVYKKIKTKLGKNFIAGVSGGGALPGAVDRFFDAIGVLILEGYGLTETAPVLGVRLKTHPVIGTVGPVLRGTEIKIVGDKGEALGPGQKGVIYVRGPQVMMGYYKRQDLTDRILDKDGWLDTGDLGMLSYNGEIKITGRAKDTIVLRGGENIEPLPIEQRLAESAYIQQAVILGQDEKFLAALIVPKQEGLLAWAEENSIPYNDYETLLQQPVVKELIDSEVSSLISPKNGFKPFERIFRFALLPESFQPGRELSAKQEIKRHAINELYKKQIRGLFAKD